MALSERDLHRIFGTSVRASIDRLVERRVLDRREGGLGAFVALCAAGAGLGMQTADMALRAMLQAHVISAEEADWHATDRDVVRGLSLRT